MSNVTTKLVTDIRLKQLLDCYGSEPSSWPEGERQAALSLLKGSSEHGHYREEIRELDKLLSRLQAREDIELNQTAIQSLEQRILGELPEQEVSASINSRITKPGANDSIAPAQNRYRSRFWMGSIAASLFVVALSTGVVHLLFSPTQNAVNLQNSNLQPGNEFTQWAWEEVTGESPVIDSESDPATLLALVDMELPVE